MVTFLDGKPAKKKYRHFRIKTVEGADDYGMMYECPRRYRKALEEGDLPDLALLDGGRGQLNVAVEVFKELDIGEVDLISLAKERALEGGRSSGVEKTEEGIPPPAEGADHPRKTFPAGPLPRPDSRRSPPIRRHLS